MRKAKPRASPVSASSSCIADQRLEQGGDLAVDEMLQAPFDLFRHVLARFVIDEGLHRGRSGSAPGDQLAHRRSPHIRPPCSVKSISVSGAL